MTRFIGLTGGIGSGKSEALAALERLGAATLSTDAVTHELLAGEELRDLLVERWGPDMAPGGEVDRAKIAEKVFGQPDELAWLESQLHPRVGGRVAEWRESLDPATEVAVVEVPLLFETGMEELFDSVIAVTAADEIRERRLEARGDPGLEGREQRQLDQDEKAARADHVVVNDGTIEDLERELADLFEKLAEEPVAG